MLKQKKKITRKELKQDKFVIFALQAKTFFEEHSRTIFQGGLLLIILVAIAWFYLQSKRSAATEATGVLGQAQLELQTGNRDRAITLLQELAERFEGTAPAGQGTFLLAKLYWEQRNFEQAKTYFKKYIDDYGNDKILMPAALAGYADCLMQEKKLEEAAKYYERAATVNPQFPEAVSFLYSAAVAYRDAGNIEKARQLSEKILKEYETSPYKNKAELLLALLKYQG